VAHVAALTTVELQQSTGCRMPDVHHNAAAQARLLAANHDALGFDAVSFIINYFGEPAALGVEMDWGTTDRLPAFRSHPWQRAEDATIPGDLLNRPPITTYLETLRIAKSSHGHQMGVLGKVMGPFSMAQVMHGIEPLLVATLENHELVSHLLDVCRDILVRCANAQLDAGADAIAIGEGGAGAQMLSPATYERLLLPVHERMIAEIDGPTVLHICGNILPRIHLLGRTGVTCFNFDWAIPPDKMVAAADGQFTLMGNVNTADLLHATPAEIVRQTLENRRAGVHIISPGCAVSPRCPNENLRAMYDAVATEQC
jgi:[methyl-Co(III) methanol-specific corrinoid protein]:coenzyme M methyltransferase